MTKIQTQNEYKIEDLLVVFKGNSKFGDGNQTYRSIAIGKNFRSNQQIAEALIGMGVREIDLTTPKVVTEKA